MALKAELHEYKKRPIIAILTMDDEKKGFRGNRENFHDLIEAGKERNILVYVTTVKLLDLRERQTAGYTCNLEKNSWIRQMFPQPHVIYNRIPFREDEMSADVQDKMAHIRRHPRVQMFNPAFFNKWELIGWLNESKITSKYLPITLKMSEDTKLLPLLKQHSAVYLKPESGKAGAGIMRIRRKINGKPTYLLSVQIKRKSRNFRFNSLKRLRARIKKMIGKEKYIVQQGIDLVHNKKRPFDLRVLVQKNGKGKWTLTGIGGRVAGELSITTHVPRGGSIDNPKYLLRAVFGASRGARILRRAQQAALAIARQIEIGAGTPLGEMSMDLGVDENGDIWFFEANSKPMKFDEPQIRKKSLERIIQYSIFLANGKNARANFYGIEGD